MIAHADLLGHAQNIASFYGADKPTSNNNNWHIRCPLCNSPDALHMTATDRLVFHCFACKAPMQQLLSAIVKDGFDPGVRTLTPAPESKKQSHLTPNPIAHEQFPDWESESLFDQTKSTDPQPVTMAYRYEDNLGRLVFMALEAETKIPNSKKPGKFIKLRKPWSSVHNSITNTDIWHMGQMMARGRPLYNLPAIVNQPDKPILIVEGEGKAIIAQIQHPEYVVTTWSQGMSAWKATDLVPIQNRKVTLWPDNSEDSIKNFLSLAANIQPSPKIAFLQPLEDRPMDWDLADEVTETMMATDLLLSQAIQLTAKDLKGTAPIGNVNEIVAKYGEHLRVILMMDKFKIYDTKHENSDPNSLIPYAMYNSIFEAQTQYSKRIEVEGKNKKPVHEVDIWFESEEKIRCMGFEYDPTVDKELLELPNKSFKLNRFTGYPHKPVACEGFRYECYMEHIYNIMDKISADYMLDWLRHLIQEPVNKPGVMLMLTGRPLSGKTIIGQIMQSMLGKRNVVITDGRSFIDGNTGSVSGKILGVINEWRQDKINEEWLRTAITDDHVTFVDKYVKKYTEKSCLRLIGTTNVPVLLGSDDRRTFPIEVVNPNIDNLNRQNADNIQYYKRLDKLKYDEVGLAGLHSYLQTSKITQNVLAAPRTDYRQNALKPESIVQQIIQEIAFFRSMPSDFPLYVKPKVDNWPDPYDSRYPKFLAKEWLTNLALARGSKSSHNALIKEFNKYIPTKSITAKTDVSFMVTDRQNNNERLEARKMVFELPPVEVLRDVYNKEADQPVTWPELSDNVIPFKPAVKVGDII